MLTISNNTAQHNTVIQDHQHVEDKNLASGMKVFGVRRETTPTSP